VLFINRFWDSFVCFIGTFALVCILVALAASGAGAQSSAIPPQSNQKDQQSSTPASSAAGRGSSSQAKPKYDVPGVDPKTGVPLYETIQEDWSSLAIGVSKLEPEAPLVGEVDHESGFTRTMVRLQWRPGDPVDLYIIVPDGVKKPPVVLYLYGYQEDTDRFRNNRWCTHVTSGGVAAVGFVSALSTSRFRNRPMRQWFVSQLQESLGSTVHDVHFILDYLAQRGDLDMDRVGMFGQSSGGTIALLSAAADPRIKVVDALDPWGDWPVWLKSSPVLQDDSSHTDFTSPQFLKKVAPLDPVKWLPTLTSTRVRIQQVKDNPATPAACQKALRAAAPKRADLAQFENVSELGASEGGGGLFDWIKQQLKSLPSHGQNQSLMTQAHTQASGTAERPAGDR